MNLILEIIMYIFTIIGITTTLVYFIDYKEEIIDKTEEETRKK